MKTQRIVVALFAVTVMIAILAGCKNKTTEPQIQTVAAPTFSPPGGTYTIGQNVTIQTPTLGATILYTTDGTEPSSSSQVYGSPIIVSSNTTIRAKAFKDGWKDSATAVATYTINPLHPGGFVFVEGGTFNNGTSDVTISSFYIDKYELTQAGYQAVMDSNPARGNGDGDSYPVFYVTWLNAIEYCNRRSIQEGLTPCYSYSTYGTNPVNWPTNWNIYDANHTNVSCDWTANGYRLPTEMEWMFAARGGNQTHNYTYSGSNDINAVAWYDGNAGYTTYQVGTKAPNELGIFDMSGNVWEWVWDIWGSYPNGNQTDPHGATTGRYHVWRGGGWLENANGCTVSHRGSNHTTYGNRDVGFRVCRVSPSWQVSAPSFTPPAGSYTSAQSVRILTATADASIRYTLDGSEPSESHGLLYTTPIAVSNSTIIKAIAYKDNYLNSEVVTAEYTIAAIPPGAFAFVEGGTFHKGISNVTISSFYIDKYELTQAEYEAVMGSIPANGYGVGASYPVYYVSWFKAIEYCNRRSMLEQRTPCYSYSNYGTNPVNWPSGWNSDYNNHTNVSCNWTADGYRLPTEMEWMFAAKGGNLTHNYAYSGSNDINTVAWYYYNSGNTTHPVGTKAPNELGIFDMSGNVSEYVWDIWGSDPSGSQTDPHGATSGSNRVVRGGSWFKHADGCTVYHRGFMPAIGTYIELGFRVCRVSP